MATGHSHLNYPSLGIINSSYQHPDPLPVTDWTFELKETWNLPDPWRYVADSSSEEDLAKLDAALNLLEPRTADILYLVSHCGWTQLEIARFFHISQPSVCYLLRSGAGKLKLLVNRPNVTEDQIRDYIHKSWTSPGWVRTNGGGTFQAHSSPPEKLTTSVLAYWRTRSQSVAARELGKSQGYVRGHVQKVIHNIRANLPDDPLAQKLAECLGLLASTKELPSRPWTGVKKRLIVDAF